MIAVLEEKVMSAEIREYFMEKYKASGIYIVYSHLPDFKSLEEVDQWFEDQMDILNYARNRYPERFA